MGDVDKKAVTKTEAPKNWIEKFWEAPWSDWHPSMEVKETDKDRTYVVDVGQMTAGDLDLKLQEDVLTLRGFHEEKTENSVSSKSFQRSFTVPSDMKMETIKTELKDGKLSIKMSKRDPPITIPIQSA
mmetsp:Transcript_2723/g.5169  ORF Transcript_2723/g.5169 Transcript_2723/m.5169 type:complete len:128 (-) Transcript_2723:355-738(-)|eukprot:CAMPEP_0170199234 /NCGR_PEP_ID=MMETSP0040_2-20121228/69226_1 /TAXON_ID=641309 /ORGANISM="Lotharella oceanica, Strain CCMP622" /LENGTH=127 /DNA_ID=CAMNT_0010449333 /DNA_START=146 /DNA_END=529 /DNA_ORIENTATION=-